MGDINIWTDKIQVNHAPGQDSAQKSSVLLGVLNKEPSSLLLLLKQWGQIYDQQDSPLDSNIEGTTYSPQFYYPWKSGAFF